MIEFLYHTKFDSEMKSLLKKYKNQTDVGFESLKNLLSKQFDVTNPEIVIGNSKIHRILDMQPGVATIWKVEMSIKGLRPSQWPRVWFLLSVDKIYFLHVATHQDNYDNTYSTREAGNRANDFI